MTYIRLDKLRQQYKPQMPATFKVGYELMETPFDYPEDDYEMVKARFPHTFGLPLLTFKMLEESHLSDPTIYFDPSLRSGAKGTRQTLFQSERPLHVGVLFSGGQAPGGHNVVVGIYDALKRHSAQSRLYGFLMGPGGLLRGEYKELTGELIQQYRNSGGFDMIGSDRTKLEKQEDLQKVLQVAHDLALNALVIIGGDDSNTNANLLAEYALSIGDPLQVIGCPKTIDGDLKNEYVETSFGFDTCVKVYAELVGNIQRDCFSAKKYYHFIKLMGRSASHLTLECALMCQPTMAIISEEVKARKITLSLLIGQIADVIQERSAKGLTFGTILIPEGLIEFLPGVKELIQELNRIPLETTAPIREEVTKASHQQEHEAKTACDDDRHRVQEIASRLSRENSELFLMLPMDIALSLATERDPHGNVQVSRIPTEQLLADMVKAELEKRRSEGLYEGSFSVLTHFFGYEGRSSMPSNFDASYCYSLGLCATELIVQGKTAYLATLRNLIAHPTDWVPTGLPLTAMMDFEERGGEIKPVIGKAVVDLKGAPMRYFRHHRKEWASGVSFRYPGPLQFFGPSAICDNTTITLRLEQGLSAYENSEPF